MLLLYLLTLVFYGVDCQRYRPPVEFTELMGQCEDLMCNRTSTCEFRNTTCFRGICPRLHCVPIITKPGICPPGVPPSPGMMMDCDALAEYLPSCYEDNHCPGTQKCCPGRCLFRECQDVVMPTLSTSLTTLTTARPTTSRLLVLPNNDRPDMFFDNRAVDNPLNVYIKDGSCPYLNPNWNRGLCRVLSQTLRRSQCLSDSDCAGDRKCCPGQCGYKECQMAIFSKNGSALGTVERASRNNNAPRYLPAATTIVLPLFTTPTVTTLPVTPPPTFRAPRPPPKPAGIIPALVIPQVTIPTTTVVTRPPAPTTTVATSAVKPGTCPPKDRNWSIFCRIVSNSIKSCVNDEACPEFQKCCPGRCGLECKAPLITSVDTTAAFIRNYPSLGLGVNISSLLTPTNRRVVPAAPRVASCPPIQRTTSEAPPGGRVDLVNLFVCNLLYRNKSQCARHLDCPGETLCCRTLCADYRCQDPIYS